MGASCSAPPGASGETRLNSRTEAAIIRREPGPANTATQPAATQIVRVKASEGRRGRHVIPLERSGAARSFLQYLVHERDRRGSLPHRGGHSFLVAAADVPGGCGARASGHGAAARSAAVRSGPVLMTPLSSRTTQPSSQLVVGSAPVI